MNHARVLNEIYIQNRQQTVCNTAHSLQWQLISDNESTGHLSPTADSKIVWDKYKM